MTSTTIRLEDAAVLITKGTTPTTIGYMFVDNGIPFIRAEDIKGGEVLVHAAAKRITPQCHTGMARSQLRPKDLLITIAGTVGRVGVVPDDVGEANCNQAVSIVRLKPDLFELPFLVYFVRSAIVQRQFRLLGTTATITNVSLAQIRDLKIPVVGIDAQRRIVDVLSRAEGIVHLRREAEKKAAELIPALFLDMFGDPATNPKGWPAVRLGDLADKMSDGPFGSNLKTSHYAEAGVRVLRLQNVGVGYLNDADKTYVSPAHFKTLPRHRCQPGDVIIATLGDPNLRACVLPDSIPEALNKADCVQFRCRSGTADPEYICWLMNTPSTLGMAASIVQGITRPRISMGRLRELVVPVPTLPVQNTFADGVRQIRFIQSQQEAATARAGEVFDVLLSRTFAA